MKAVEASVAGTGLLVLAALLVCAESMIVGCSTGHLSESHHCPRGIAGVLPDWAGRTEPGYFVGLSDGEETQKAARDGALADARRQIVNYLGVQLSGEQVQKVLYRRVETGTGATARVDDEHDMSYQIQTRSLAKSVLAVREDRLFVECRESAAGQAVWHGWARVPFDLEAHRRFLDDLVGTLESMADDALHRAEQIGLGEPGLALRLLAAVAGSARKLDGVTLAAGQTSTRVQQVWGRADAALATLLSDLVLEASNPIQILRGAGRGPAPLEVRATTRSGQPINGLPLTFMISGGRVLREGETQSDGLAKFRVPGDLRQQGALLVTASVGGPWLWDVFDGVQPRSVDFTIAAGKDRLLVLVLVELPGGVSLAGNPFEERLIGALAKRGLDVIAARSLDPKVAGIDSAGRFVEWFRGGDYSALVWVVVDVRATEAAPYGPNSAGVAVTVDLQVLDPASGDVRLTVGLPDAEFRDMKGFGFGSRGLEQAVRDALSVRLLKQYPGFFDSIAARIQSVL